MYKIFHNIDSLITMDTKGQGFKKNLDLGNIGILNNYAIVVENGLIADLVPENKVISFSNSEIIDLGGRCLMPGLVEAHTHLIFAGSRSNEFRDKLKGKTYEEISAEGGGINSTVKAVREASEVELYKNASYWLDNFIRQGVTSIEIKTGYGLDYDSEAKMLKVINKLKSKYPINIVSTFLGAHTYPVEYKENHEEYLNLIIDKMLPDFKLNLEADFCDIFCEKTAFNQEETEKILERAKELNYLLTIHTDQFNNIGGIDSAVKYGVRSLSHLEVLDVKEITKLKDNNIACILLPGVSYLLRYNYAPARALIAEDVITALASDFNPGSCPISNISLIMSLAAINMELTIEEILSMYTINSAYALNISNKTGSLEIGKEADFMILDSKDYSDIVYYAGRNKCYMTIKNGNILFKNGGIF